MIRFSLILLFFSLTIACKKQDNSAAATTKPNAMPATPIEGFIVKKRNLDTDITANGTLLATEETELHPEASGRVVALNLPEGKMVRKGELLLKIFDEDLQNQLKTLETQLHTAEITEQRLNALLPSKGVSQQEYDLAVLATQNLHNQIDLVRINIGKTELHAPFDGVLGLRRISIGAYASPTTAVATIRATGAPKLDFSIPEKYAPLVRIGQKVNFHIEGQSQVCSATVVATEQRISADARELLVRAHISEVGNGKNLLPGAFAEVNLSLGSNAQTIMIPTQAIIPQARDKRVYVSRNGQAKLIEVKTGVRQADLIEVVSGLQVGDTVATTGILFLKPDGALKFSKIE